ncbi:mechanosensitive ion channel family protein [Patescibacteria group bacterium]
MFDTQTLLEISQKLLRILLYLLGGQTLKRLLILISKKIRQAPSSLTRKVSAKQRQKIDTLRSLIVNTSKIIINFVVFVIILAEVGVNIAPLLTGAGILGLAVGFGAKSLVSDLIAGFFIILENQFNVGDWVQIGSSQGRVTKITLRTITLKDKDKKIYIIPNSNIKALIKYPKP